MVLKPLIGHVPRESLVVYEGVTDAVGTTTTLKCSSIGSGSDYPDFDGNQVIPTTGPYAGQARDINGATNGDVAGTITANKAFDGIIASGTSFIITGIRTTPAEVAALDLLLDAIKAKSDLMNSDSGATTITGTDSDTIIPSSLPTKMHLSLDIENLKTNNADNTILISVGPNGSERVIAYYKLVGDGADVTADTGSGTATLIKQKRIDISNILVYEGEQVLVANTKNVGGDLAIPYNYICGV